MPGVSTIPAAMQALLTMFGSSTQLAAVATANGLQQIDVYDGPWAASPGTSSLAAVCVGWAPSIASPTYATANPLVTGAIESETVQEGLGGTRDRERYTIHCCAGFLDQNAYPATPQTAFVNARTQAFAIASAVRGTIALNRNLGGQQLIAQFGQGNATESTDKNGAKVIVEFDIGVDAYTT